MIDPIAVQARAAGDGGIQTKVCAGCGGEFGCGGACWCFKLPPLFAPDERADCLCPECLTRKTAGLIRSFLENLTPEKKAQIRALGAVSRPVEGIDYTLDAMGNWVFTAWYHLRRGDCCGNLCKHCPYKEEQGH